MEENIIAMLRSMQTDKFHCEYLIDLGDEEDWNGEMVAITCDTIVFTDGKIYICDDNLENEDGSYDEEDMRPFSELDEDGRKEVMAAINMTLLYKGFQLEIDNKEGHSVTLKNC